MQKGGGHGSFKEYAQRWRTWQLKWHLNDGKNDDNDSRHITSILLWKMVGYTPSSFADLVFTGRRIKAGLKRRKFNHPTWTNEKKLGQIKRVRMKEKPVL